MSIKDGAILVAAIADTHGALPTIPAEADVLLIAGDIVPLDIQRHREKSLRWLNTTWRAWIESLDVEAVIATWGNHDFIGQWTLADEAIRAWLPAEFLIDERGDFTLSDGRSLSVWGSPWTPEFMNWAFNATREEQRKRWANIPEGLDILLVHGPPRGILDHTGAHMITFNGPQSPNVGDVELYRRLEEMDRPPRVTVFGHIHHSYGARQVGDLRFFNVSVCNEQYRPVNPVTTFAIESHGAVRSGSIVEV